MLLRQNKTYCKTRYWEDTWNIAGVPTEHVFNIKRRNGSPRKRFETTELIGLIQTHEPHSVDKWMTTSTEKNLIKLKFVNFTHFFCYPKTISHLHSANTDEIERNCKWWFGKDFKTSRPVLNLSIILEISWKNNSYFCPITLCIQSRRQILMFCWPCISV